MIGGAATHRQIQGVNVNLFLESSEDPDKKSTNEQILESCGKIDKKKMHSQNKEAGTFRDKSRGSRDPEHQHCWGDSS